MRFKIDWASLIVESKFTVLLCFTLYLRAIFQVQGPGGGAYIWRGDLTEVFLRYRVGGLLFGGADTWRGLFSEFYSSFTFFSSIRNALDCFYLFMFYFEKFST